MTRLCHVHRTEINRQLDECIDMFSPEPHQHTGSVASTRTKNNVDLKFCCMLWLHGTRMRRPTCLTTHRSACFFRFLRLCVVTFLLIANVTFASANDIDCSMSVTLDPSDALMCSRTLATTWKRRAEHQVPNHLHCRLPAA